MADRLPWGQDKSPPSSTDAGAGSGDDKSAHGPASSVPEQGQAWQEEQPQEEQRWPWPRPKASARRPSFTNHFLERLGLRRNSSSSRRMSTESNATDLGRMEDVGEAAAAADKHTGQCASPGSQQGFDLPDLQEEGLCTQLSQASLASRCSAFNASMAAGTSVSSGWSMCNSSVAGSSSDPHRQRRDSASTRRSSNSSSCAGRGDGPARSVSRNSTAVSGGSDWASVTGYEAPRSSRVAVPEEQLQAAAEAAPQAAPATSYLPYASCLNVHTLAIKVEHSPDVSFEEAAAAADAAVMRALARCPQLALQRIAVVEGCILVLLDLAALSCEQQAQQAWQGMSLIQEEQLPRPQLWQQQQRQVAEQLQQPQLKPVQQQEVCLGPEDSQQVLSSQEPEHCASPAAAMPVQEEVLGTAGGSYPGDTEPAAVPASSPAEGGATPVGMAAAAAAAAVAVAAVVPEQVLQEPAVSLLRRTLPARRGGAWTLALPDVGEQVVAPATAAVGSSSSSSDTSCHHAYLSQAVHHSVNAVSTSSSSSSSSAAVPGHQKRRRRCSPRVAGLPVVIQACGCGVATCGQEDVTLDLVVSSSSNISAGSSSSSSTTGTMRVVLSGPRGAVYDTETQLTFQRQQGPTGVTAAASSCCCWSARLHLPAAALGLCPGHMQAGFGHRPASSQGNGAATCTAAASEAGATCETVPGSAGSCGCPGHTVSVQLLPSSTWAGPGGQQPWLAPARATVLLLPPGAAGELAAWVEAQQVAVAALQGLVQDLSALLDARQLLAASSRVGRPQSATAAPIVRRLLGVARLGAVAGERLEPFLHQAGLVRLEQMAAAAKVQLLLCMALLPREVGLDRTPSPLQQPQAAEPIARSTPHATSSQAEQGAAAAAGGAPVTAWPMACMRSMQRRAASAVRAVTQRVRLQGRSTAAARRRSSPPAALAPVPSCAQPSSSSSSRRPTCGESAAAAEGGWAGMLLCWRGFSGAVVEAAYLAFKARHLLLVDWVGRVYLLVFVPSMMLRYLLTHGLWPLQKVYGWHWLLDHSIHATIMAACPGWWQRRREMWLLAYDARLLLYLPWELAQWSPQDLHDAQSGTNKLVLFGIAACLLGLQRPKAELVRWAVVAPLLTWQAAARALPGAGGVEGVVYAAAQAGGWQAVVLSLGFLAAHLLAQMALSYGSDLYSRRVFVRHATTLQGTDGCGSRGSASSSAVAASGCASSSSGRAAQAYGASPRQRQGVTGHPQKVA